MVSKPTIYKILNQKQDIAKYIAGENETIELFKWYCQTTSVKLIYNKICRFTVE